MWSMATNQRGSKKYRQFLIQLGQNIQWYLDKQGLTWDEASKKLQVARNTVGRWVHAECPISLERLLQVCDLCKCSMQQLLPS